MAGGSEGDASARGGGAESAEQPLGAGQPLQSAEVRRAPPRRGARDGEAPRGAWDAFGAPLPPWPRDSVLSPALTPLSAACKNPPRCSLHIAPRPRPWTPGSAPRGGAPRAARVYVSVCEAAARASRSIAAAGRNSFRGD